MNIMYPQPNSSLAELLASLPEAVVREAIQSLPEAKRRELLYQWRGWMARPEQLRPGTSGAKLSRKDWHYWLVQAGRGFGKTRMGAETVRELVNEGYRLIHLVGALQKAQNHASRIRFLKERMVRAKRTCAKARPTSFPTAPLTSKTKKPIPIECCHEPSIGDERSE